MVCENFSAIASRVPEISKGRKTHKNGENGVKKISHNGKVKISFHPPPYASM